MSFELLLPQFIMQDDDKLLLNQLKSGQKRAFESLFKKYYKAFSTQAFYLLGDDMEAEDLVQHVFIEFWERKQYDNINTSVKAYLQRTIHNSCLNIIEKRKTAKRRLDAYSYGRDAECPEADIYEKHERQKYLDTVLESLPLQQGQAFNLVYMENKKYKDAAREMGISINSIKTHLKLAVKHLRERIKIR